MPPTEAEIAEKQKDESRPGLAGSTQRGDVGAGTQSAKYASPKPSPCRIVLFNHSPVTLGAHETGGSEKIDITQSPAIVMFVNPTGTLRLCVWSQHGGPPFNVAMAQQYIAERDSVRIPPDPNGPPGTWQWPARV